MSDLVDVLHIPRRADHIEGLEEHLRAASSLARALWIAAIAEDSNSIFRDNRDRDAFCELASSIADHATAALFTYLKEGGS